MVPLKYRSLSESIQKSIAQDRDHHVVNSCRCDDSRAFRRNMERDKANLWRPAFVRDVEKILHLPLYNRYADKTQVFSFYHNDDLSRRALHVQLVSRIARNIGGVLGLNLDLIEAIALGHDLGHTPFGHAGERFLSELLQSHTGRTFHHNVQSVRVLDTLFARNITLQTLDGILCHNGEFEMQEYRPCPLSGFDELQARMERCYTEGDDAVGSLVPSTLEACVVRICDMIAYLGKDRQDAQIARIIPDESTFTAGEIGRQNAAIINNMTVDILEQSYGKDFIHLSAETYEALRTAKKENYSIIYKNEQVNLEYETLIKPMFQEVYSALLEQLRKGDKRAVIYRHHVNFIQKHRSYYVQEDNYLLEEPNQIVADYIASMTDDYFISLHRFLFPKSSHRIEYKSYFEDVHKD